MVARAVPFFAGKHKMLVPSTSDAYGSPGRRMSGGRSRNRAQVQGMGVRAQVLRDRPADQGLHHQPDGVGREFVLPSFLRVNSIRRRFWKSCVFYSYNLPMLSRYFQ